MKTAKWFGLALLAGTFTACQQSGQQQEQNASADTTEMAPPFDLEVEGDSIKLFTLSQGDLKVAITNYGARIVNIWVPDKNGTKKDVVLGYDQGATYKKYADSYFGAIVGRYGNRIAKGKFTLDGKAYQLETNDGPNTLHGGNSGFSDKIWTAEQIDDRTLKLTYVSPDGEAGYPGKLTSEVTYHLNDNNGLDISYALQSDQPTVANLTNHAYFNLNGEGEEDILQHELQIAADRFTPVDKTLIPTGELKSVEGTPFDFRKAKAIGKEIEAKDEQLEFGLGYDHNFVLNKVGADEAVITVYSPLTGIEMKVYTDQPGVQFYSGNFLKAGMNNGKGGKDYGHRTAFCLETQHYPDSPNQPKFPTTVIKPGETFKSKTTYAFQVRD